MLDDHLLDKLRRTFPQHQSANWSVFDFLSAEGSVFDALWYSRLFCPEFVEKHGMVFLKETLEASGWSERLERALGKYGQDRSKTEQAFNYTDVEELFPDKDDATHEELLFLLQRLASMWMCCLRTKFPDRRFHVEVIDDEAQGNMGLLFYQVP